MDGFNRRMAKAVLLLNVGVLCVLALLVCTLYRRNPSMHIAHVGDGPKKVEKRYQGYKLWKPRNSKSFITIQNLTQSKVGDGVHAFGKVNDKYDKEPRSPLKERHHVLDTIPNKTDHRERKRSHGVLYRTPTTHKTVDVSGHHTTQSKVHLVHKQTHNSLRKGLPFYMPATEQIPGLFSYSLLKEGEERHPLVNLHQYQFTLNPELCQAGHVYLLTIVHSAMSHFHYRRRIRQTFGSVRKAMNKTVVLVFAVGVSKYDTLQNSVVREADEFKDMIQGNFIDVYRNLSLKHIMGYHWMLNHCPEAEFVLKMDDDVFMNPYVIVKYLTQLKESTNQMICTVFKGYPPVRGHTSKYYVPKTMYPLDMYPDFCQGFAYVISQDLLRKLYKASSVANVIAMDDVYVTGILRSLTGIMAKGFGTLRMDCRSKRPITISQLNRVGVMMSVNFPLKNVFEKWNSISIYTDSSYHSSDDDESRHISIC